MLLRPLWGKHTIHVLNLWDNKLTKSKNAVAAKLISFAKK